MYKHPFLFFLTTLSYFSSTHVFAAEDRYFAGFQAGRSHYTHNDTNDKGTSTVLTFSLGQQFKNNVFVAASYLQYEQLNIVDQSQNKETNYDISGVRLSIGKEVPVYDFITTSADIGVMRWLEKREIVDTSAPDSEPVTEDEKYYALSVGFNLNFTLSDKTKVSLRLQGSSTENFGFRTSMVSMQFDI